MKIGFFDISNTGHHWFYNSNLMLNISQKFSVVYITKKITEDQILFLKNNNIEVEVLKSYKKNGTTNKFAKQLELYKDFYSAKKIARQRNINVFVNLYFDPYILTNFLVPEKFKTINILHWFPNNKFKVKLLSRLKVTNNTYFLVHTNDIKKKLETINKEIKVTKIDYPVKEIRNDDYNKKSLLAALKLPDNLLDAKIILYFGGTRHDKGLDILINSLKFVTSDITLLIVGKEETFSQEFINESLKKLNIEIQVNTMLNYVPEEDVQKYYYISDAIVLPYRKYFNGESGILTDAIQMGKPVIVPNIIHFPDTVSSYNNGLTFEPESTEDLASAIDKLVLNLYDYTYYANKAKGEFSENRNFKNFSKLFLESFSLNRSDYY